MYELKLAFAFFDSDSSRGVQEAELRRSIAELRMVRACRVTCFTSTNVQNTDAEAAFKVHTEKDMARVLALLLPGMHSS